MNRLSKQSKTISIVAGSELSDAFLPDIRRSFVVGVDRGAVWLLNHGVIPDIALGDFDSVSKSQKHSIHDSSKMYIEFSREKDETDLELAIHEAIKRKPAYAIIYGVLGKRQDHAMAAIQLLGKLVSHNIYGVIVDNFNKIHIVRHQEKFSRSSSYKYFSILPFTQAAKITLKGFKYDVVKKVFSKKNSLGISNEIRLPVATLTVHRGLALIIQSRD